MENYSVKIDPYRFGESNYTVMPVIARSEEVVRFKADPTPLKESPLRWSKKPERGDKVVWARMLEKRPLAIVNLEYVTVASWGLPEVPLGVTLEEVAGVFPSGYFDPFTGS